MTSNHFISILLALAFLLNGNHCVVAQSSGPLSRTPLLNAFNAEPRATYDPQRKNHRRAPGTSSPNGLRLAQDPFHSVRKPVVSPFAPPADPAVPNVKTIGTHLKAFGVPFRINANDDSFIEVQLYLSRDMGKTWKFYARQDTDRNDFPFEADQDGEYWFSLKTLDRDRRLLPEGDPQAELKIVVDTVKPTLDFRIEADAAGRVVCRWNVRDENLLPESFRILYQPVSQNGQPDAWQQVPVDLNGKARVGVYADQIAWWPETTERQLNVAIEIRDVAGNVAQATRNIVVPQTAWRHRAESVAQITDANRSRQADEGTLAGPVSTPTVGPSTSPSDPDPTTVNSMQQPNIKHPPNIVCENGVCRIVPTQLIGSEVEQADPPNPEDFSTSSQPPPTQSPTDNAGTKPGSVVWQSDPQVRLSRNQSVTGTTIGSTMRPDPSLAPRANPMQVAAKPVTNVPSNPATSNNVGDQVVSESSTMGRTNQYRGLNSRGGASLPPPTLLPREPGDPMNGLAEQSAVARYPNTGHAGFESIASHAEPGVGERGKPGNSSGGFSTAGYPNSGATDSADRSFVPASNSVAGGTAQTMPGNADSAMQIIGTKRFRLDYGIDAIDPSGVARVDLWMTLDGRTWNAWGSDPDNQSPFPVEVENDGRYGFRVVVHSRDGLTGQGPSTGDAADLWVLVDTQSPLAHISSVPYGRGNEAGRLVINYSVSDEQITLRPITLAYSESPQGPWNLIGEGLRNESRYVWKPTTDVPDQIYLRIEALDKAGNVGVHVLSQAIDVSGLVPRGTIRGVSPVGH